MNGSAQMTGVTNAPDEAPAELLCPACGYDLRSATTDRCSECGLVIDRAALARSAMPWAHRREIGRLRAFVRTVWAVTWDRRSIRHELARPQDPRDARAFMRWVAACVAAALMILAAQSIAEHGPDRFGVRMRSSFGDAWGSPAGPQLPGYLDDLTVPWSAGIALWPALPVYLVGLALYLASAGRPLMRRAAQPERATAMATYAAGPLAWLLPAAVLFGGAYWAFDAAASYELARQLRPVRRAADVVGGVLTFVAVLNYFRRSGEWYTRARHGGAGQFAIGLARLLLSSLLGTVVFLGLLPWCVGLLWIIADSFG